MYCVVWNKIVIFSKIFSLSLLCLLQSTLNDVVSLWCWKVKKSLQLHHFSFFLTDLFNCKLNWFQFEFFSYFTWILLSLKKSKKKTQFLSPFFKLLIPLFVYVMLCSNMFFLNLNRHEVNLISKQKEKKIKLDWTILWKNQDCKGCLCMWRDVKSEELFSICDWNSKAKRENIEHNLTWKTSNKMFVICFFPLHVVTLFSYSSIYLQSESDTHQPSTLLWYLFFI